MSDKHEGLRRAAENALTLSEDYPWPQNEILVLPPFCVSRVFIAHASPDVILSLLQERDQLLARESPEDAWRRGWMLGVKEGVGHPMSESLVEKMVPPYSAPKGSKS